MRHKLIAGLLLWTMIAPAACAEGAVQVDVGYRMLKPLYDAQGQFVCSPASLRTALSMAARGAAGETKAQLDALLGGPGGTDPAAYQAVRSANAALVAPDAALLDDYRAALAEDFGAALMPLDGDVAANLNGWVAERTDGMIEQVLAEKPGADVKLMLVNALALDAEWAHKFDSEHRDTFHGAAGDREADFMAAEMALACAETDGLRAVRLPYAGGRLEMVVALPEPGRMGDLLARLGGEGASALGAFSEPRGVKLAMPRFSMETELSLRPLLMELGVTDAFFGDADFSRMTGGTELYLSAMLQKARIDVDRDGTRAAAATSVYASAKGIRFDVVKMTVDRPFLLLVRAVDGGDLLFAAVIEDL